MFSLHEHAKPAFHTEHEILIHATTLFHTRIEIKLACGGHAVKATSLKYHIRL